MAIYKLEHKVVSIVNVWIEADSEREAEKKAQHINVSALEELAFKGGGESFELEEVKEVNPKATLWYVDKDDKVQGNLSITSKVIV